MIGVTDAQVDAEAGHADLRDYLPTVALQLRRNGVFKWRLGRPQRPSIFGW